MERCLVKKQRQLGAVKVILEIFFLDERRLLQNLHWPLIMVFVKEYKIYSVFAVTDSILQDLSPVAVTIITAQNDLRMVYSAALLEINCMHGKSSHRKWILL